MPDRTESRLVIVPGHGVCIAPTNPTADASWVGIFEREGECYVKHAEQGVMIAGSDQSSLVVFSGGQTREAAGRRSEGSSYLEIAKAADWWGHPDLSSRAVAEEFARDSFENLLFSLALFRKETERWPEMLTVVGWKFKAKRFDLHRQALKWPKASFRYVGVNDPSGAALDAATSGEKIKTDAVTRDLFLTGSEWNSQRELRDPFQRGHPYRGVDPQLDPVFEYLDRFALNASLPWIAPTP